MLQDKCEAIKDVKDSISVEVQITAESTDSRPVVIVTIKIAILDSVGTSSMYELYDSGFKTLSASDDLSSVVEVNLVSFLCLG